MSKLALDSMNPFLTGRKTLRRGIIHLSHSFTTTLKRPLAGTGLAYASMVVVKEA